MLIFPNWQRHKRYGRRYGPTIVAVLAIVLSTVGCDKTDAIPDIVYGSARPSGSKLDVTVSATGALVSNWPDACTVLDDNEIKAIVPQASSITRIPKKITFLPNFKHGSLSGGRSQDAPRGSCDFEFTLPDRYSDDSNSEISVTLAAISTPAAITEYYADQKVYDEGHEVAPAWGAQECFVGNQNAHCHIGRFYFEVWTSTSRYDIGQGKDGNQTLFWRDKVLPPVVTTVAARMS